MAEYTPRIVYRGKPIADNQWAADSVLIDSISLRWGRDDIFSPVAPAVLKFKIHASTNEAVNRQFPRGFISEEIIFSASKVYSSGDGPGNVVLFRGRIIDAKIHIRRKKGSIVNRFILEITAADMLREFGMNLVGEIKSFRTSGTSTTLSTVFSSMPNAFREKNYSTVGMALSPEMKNVFDRTQVYLGDGFEQTWLDYLNEIYGVALAQSFYYDPAQSKLVGTALPALYGSESLDSWVPNSESQKLLTSIDESKISGDAFLEFSPKVVGFIKQTYYSQTWKPASLTWQVDPNARSRGLATMQWKNRQIGQITKGVNFLTQYLRDQKVLPKPPSLEYRSGSKVVDNPEYWLTPNDSRYAWLKNTDHARFLSFLGVLKIPGAKPINGEITYRAKRGWEFRQELRWAIQKTSGF